MIYINGYNFGQPMPQWVPSAQRPDYTRVGNAMRIVAFDGTAH
jgi:hypothetical protein